MDSPEPELSSTQGYSFKTMKLNSFVLLLVVTSSYLVLECGTTKGPDSSKDKIKFIQLFGAVWRGILLGEEAFKEGAQHLNHALLRNWNNLLKSIMGELKTYEV